ncbi:histone-like nucleoid-structuring protein Lsr2 [Dermatophilus congolensis]|uniref:histone-like nucleoid-structuring protein Lsr2 n=1 Tax=Dermatophilus congolensis TaxID=1863 RepID=UPI001AAE7817|nr:Lsr2 family protein [Dermatophilus congolensis]MBO3143008.1 Lsr2 family protein [Dermatophilus congolensis]MBO3151996.1 Lsr2 family protein [Dermatophilus congolensis]MBO3160995.1 Lsr2 family protein [Dermatophilus congolensis]MBO3163281.1 Lsr2 family protein [Dermatophilus congolensis]MBO3176838.1 Lsr2 family protein [Dermatophilus congolensis]
MAKKVEVVLLDDMDGKQAEEVVKFELDRVQYEIDLSAANAERLRQTLADWVAKARRVSSGRAAKGKAAGMARSSELLKDIRQWARAHGHEINERGRIPAHLERAYREAHNLTGGK